MEKTSEKSKCPKTRMDEMFISMVETTKGLTNIKSDRLMSKALGQHPNFLSRIKTGVQSVPSTVWDLLHEYWKENGIVGDNPSSAPFEWAKGLVIDSDKHRQHLEEVFANGERAKLEREANPEAYRIKALPTLTDVKQELLVATEKILLLTSQLADKERTIQILLSQQPKND